jgi:hypothetical protein
MKRQRKILHFVIMALISLLERRNEHQMIIGAVSNDSMIENRKDKIKIYCKNLSSKLGIHSKKFMYEKQSWF